MAITIRGAINPTSVSVPTSHLAEVLEGGGEPTDSFTVTKNLTHAVIKNERISGSSYYAEVEPAENWSDLSVTIKVGGVDMSNLYTSGVINIPNVTGNIVITAAAAQAALVSITAVYTQSGTVYDTDSLDSLKSDLVVTANYADSSTATVTDYTLSGTLAEGTSTVTVSYGGKTTTFNVVVTAVLWLYKNGDECTAVTGGWITRGWNTTTGGGSPSVTKEDDYLSIAFNSNPTKGVAKSWNTTNQINLSNYTTIGCKFYSTWIAGVTSFAIYFPTTISESTTQAGAYGSDYSSERTFFASDSSETAKEYSNKLVTRELALPVTGNRYISCPFNIHTSPGAGNYLHIYELYLKP